MRGSWIGALALAAAAVWPVAASRCRRTRAPTSFTSSMAADRARVDGDQFTIAEAIAIKGDRIVGVDRTADMEKLKVDHTTQAVDLRGRTVIHGLIPDNHAHFIRAAAEHWHPRRCGSTA